MSTAYCYATDAGSAPCVTVPFTNNQPLHRLAAVRRLQGVSRHTIARRLNIDVGQVQQQESENADMSLSALYAWSEILDVPVAELLAEPRDQLTAPILLRSQLLRLMKTVQAISERTKQDSVRWMAQTMVNELVEIMPELAGVGEWTAGGKRRSLRDLGAAAQRRISDEMLVEHDGHESATFYASFAG